jgi:hypothetical protein
MALTTLYRNYTVIVQDSDSPYYPKNDLELLLYEGRLEIKPDPTDSGNNAVFQYGTTTKAVRVQDSDGANVSATAIDSTSQPGEYKFTSLDLDATTSGNSGTTLYSVVARPVTDSATNSFERASVIVDRTDISDPNLKQLVKASVGSTDSITDNMAIAGGTVTFEQYEHDDNGPNLQHVKITNISSIVTELREDVSTVPSYASSTNKERLIGRFNVFYSTTDGSEYLTWTEVPAYRTDDDSWVIRLQGDEYNISRSHDIGSGPTDINLGGILTSLTISLSYAEGNIHIRSFDSTPSTTLPGVDATKEKVCVHSFIDGSGNRIVGVGKWSYSDASNTPSYNLDVKGDVGIRANITGGNTQLSITPTTVALGPDTSSTLHSLSFSSFGSIYTRAYVNNRNKLDLSNSNTYLGYDLSSYPYVHVDSTSTSLKTSAYTYLSLNTSDEITAYINVGSSAKKVLELKVANQEIGYDLAGTKTSWSATTNLLKATVVNQIQIQGTASSLITGVNIATYPKITYSTSYIRVGASSSSYWESVYNDGEHLRAKVNAKTCLDLDAETDAVFSSPFAKIGYDIDTGYSAKYTPNDHYVYEGTTERLKMTSSLTKLSLVNGSNSSYMEMDSESCTLYGTDGSTTTTVVFGNTNSITTNTGIDINMTGSTENFDVSLGPLSVFKVAFSTGNGFYVRPLLSGSFANKTAIQIPHCEVANNPTDPSEVTGSMFLNNNSGTHRIWVLTSEGWKYISLYS